MNINNKIQKCLTPKNLLQSENITNDSLWVIDETIFSYKYTALFVINLKTCCIIGSIVKKAHYKFTHYVPDVCDPNGYPSINSKKLIELYKQLLQFTTSPKFIHSDCKSAYISSKVRDFLQNKHILLSSTESKQNQNQVSESINNRMKDTLIQNINESRSIEFKVFKKQWPNEFKTRKNKATRFTKEFRDYFFDSTFFNEHVNVPLQVQKAIVQYNENFQPDFKINFSRVRMEQLNRFIVPEEFRKTKSKHYFDVHFILEQNRKAYAQVNQKQQKLITKGHTPIVEPIVQEVMDIDKTFKSLYEFAPEAQKPVLATIILTHSKQTNLIEEQTKQLKQQTKNISQLHTDNEDLNFM